MQPHTHPVTQIFREILRVKGIQKLGRMPNYLTRNNISHCKLLVTENHYSLTEQKKHGTWYFIFAFMKSDYTKERAIELSQEYANILGVKLEIV
jgi:hypothetical protein